MKNKEDMKKQIYILRTAATLTAFVPQLTAAEAEVKTDVEQTKAETRDEIKRNSDVDVTVDTKPEREAVRRTNKASGLLGMEVRNAENQKLGEVKDLVMDMNSGRISYAVLSVGGFLGIGEKLIAVPPGALKATDAGEYMTLNADKTKIQDATELAVNDMPAAGAHE